MNNQMSGSQSTPNTGFRNYNVFNELFNLISLLSPYLIPMYLLMGSFFNQDLKGFFYIALLLLNVFLTFVTSGMFKLPKSANHSSAVCKFGPFNSFLNMFGNTYGVANNGSISINSSIIGFTMAYLLVPMYNSGNVNFSIFAVFLSLLTINGFTQIANNCTSTMGAVLGAVLGLMFGYLLVTFVANADKTLSKLLYFNEQEDGKNKCKLSKQKYTCKKITLKGPVIDQLNM